MKLINATFFIKPESREQFFADLAPLIQSSRSEAGNISYQLYEAVDIPNQFVMVEEWRDQAAIDQHNTNPLLIQLLENLKTYSSAEAIIKVTEE